MVDPFVLANINLYAILRNLEDMCELDPQMKELIQHQTISIQFVVKHGPRAHLRFQNGKVTLTRGSAPSDIKLYFRSPQHLNDMFTGKANPIPLKGLFKIGFLKNEFTQLTDRLTYYLTPNDALLKDPNYFRINTYLTAYTAIFALAEIGNHDRIGKLNAYRIPDGVISIEIVDGPAIQMKAEHGNLVVAKGIAKAPRARMIFKSIEVASGILNSKLDTYTCIGSGDFEVNGFLPMIDNMNKLLIQVPNYLR